MTDHAVLCSEPFIRLSSWAGNSSPLMSVVLTETSHAAFSNRLRSSGAWWATSPYLLVEDHNLMQWRGVMPSRIQKEIESVAPLPTDAQEAREPTRKRNQYSRTDHSVIGEVHRMVEEALAVLDPKKRSNEFTQLKQRGAFLLWHHERRAIEELTAPPRGPSKLIRVSWRHPWKCGSTCRRRTRTESLRTPNVSCRTKVASVETTATTNGR